MNVSAQHIKKLNFTYAVTNAHILEKLESAGCEELIVRVNTTGGGTEIFATKLSKWVKHPEGDDVAALSIGTDNSWSVKTIPIKEFFLTREQMTAHNIGLGDETITFGRFAPHSGVLANLTTARFGRIAMEPQESVRQTDRNNFAQESFLVEAHSIGGYSGSPVFVQAGGDNREAASPIVESRAFLLGVDWGHFNINGRITNIPSTNIQIPSGMMGVVPVWKIQDVLNHQVFTLERDILEDCWEQAFRKLSIDIGIQEIDEQVEIELREEYNKIKQERHAELLSTLSMDA